MLHLLVQAMAVLDYQILLVELLLLMVEEAVVVLGQVERLVLVSTAVAMVPLKVLEVFRVPGQQIEVVVVEVVVGQQE